MNYIEQQFLPLNYEECKMELAKLKRINAGLIKQVETLSEGLSSCHVTLKLIESAARERTKPPNPETTG